MCICGDHFEDDSFDSSWMLQSTRTYSDRLIQKRLRPGTIPTKFPHKPMKERHFPKRHLPKQHEETHRIKEGCFPYSSETMN